MYPFLLQLGPLTLHTYGVMLALGVGLGLWVMRRLSRGAGLDPDKMQTLALAVVIAGLAGGRLAFILLEPGDIWAGLKDFFFIWRGGLVFYGGIAAAIPVAILMARRYGYASLTVADVFAPALALGQAFGRLGCFSSGDSYGKPFDGPWAVTFTDPHSIAPQGIPLHPTQLYTAGGLLIIFAVLTWFFPRRRFNGQIVFMYGLLHGVTRLIIEPFRGDWRGELIAGVITPTGLFALGLALVCAIALIVGFIRQAKATTTPADARGARP